jgi:hypothetical protein
MVYRERKFPSHTRPKTLDKKIRKNLKLKAIFRLVKKLLSKNHAKLQYLDLYLSENIKKLGLYWFK